MKERPILFSPPMVDAIWNLRKSQTRRIMPALKHPTWTGYTLTADKSAAIECGPDYPDTDTDRVRNPYGIPGDRLWVREGWAADRCFDHLKPSQIPRGMQLYYKQHSEFVYTRETHKVRSARFMCRWMSRINLLIADMRVQRLQEISEEDAVSEGIGRRTTDTHHGSYYDYSRPGEGYGCVDGFRGLTFARDSFRTLWDSINGKKHPWSSNPWVWVIDFRRIS